MPVSLSLCTVVGRVPLEGSQRREGPILIYGRKKEYEITRFPDGGLSTKEGEKKVRCRGPV